METKISGHTTIHSVSFATPEQRKVSDPNVIEVVIKYPADWSKKKFFADGDVKQVSKEVAASFIEIGIASYAIPVEDAAIEPVIPAEPVITETSIPVIDEPVVIDEPPTSVVDEPVIPETSIVDETAIPAEPVIPVIDVAIEPALEDVVNYSEIVESKLGKKAGKKVS